MANPAHADVPSQTTKYVSSQPIMKIQSTKYQVEGDVSLYPEALQMLIVALKHSVLSTAMFNSVDVPLSWLSLVGSTTTYIIAMDVTTFNLVNDKKVHLTKKLFCQILDIPNSPSYCVLTNAEVIYMFNEMSHRPLLTKIIEFKKSGLPSVWSFLFGIFLQCLTGQSVGLYKGRMEVYVMVVGIYYDLVVDFSTQMWKEFLKSVENTNVVQGVSCARYWSLILRYKYEKEGIEVPADEQKVEFLNYNFPKAIEDDEEMFPNIA